MEIVAKEDKARRVAQAIHDGATQKDALMSVGYAKTSAEGSGKAIAKALGVEAYLVELREERAATLLAHAEKSGLSQPEALRIAADAIQLIDNPKEKASMALKLAQIAGHDREDLLDRAGISKISKSLHLTHKTWDRNDLEGMKRRKAEIEAELAREKEPKELKPVIAPSCKEPIP